MNINKNNVVACILLILVFCSLSHAQEAPTISYDVERQALSINPYADGYGGTIHIDFDSDHSWGGVINQAGWNFLYGDVTDPGIFFSELDCDPSGSCETRTIYGWGGRLGSLAAVQDYHSYVTQLSDGREARNKVHYFAEVWDVASGATTLLVQPMDPSGNILPLLPEDLSHTYVQVNDGTGLTWRSLEELAPPAPVIEKIRVRLTPRHLNLARHGRWITAHIKLPKGRTAEDVDFATVKLSVKADSRDEDGYLVKSVLCSSQARVVHRRNVCEVRFSREDLQNRLVPGSVTLMVSGTFTDNAVFSGEDTIRVYEGHAKGRHAERRKDRHEDEEDEDEEDERD